MRLLFIRHGDPDYENDTLTEKGWREAALLAASAPSLKIDDCYVSPLGRAQDTASGCLKKLNKNAVTLDWLREFPAYVDLNLSKDLPAAYPEAHAEHGIYLPRGIIWDMVPSYLTAHPEYWDRADWRQSDAAICGDMVSVYDHVCSEFDRLLADYGYLRQDMHYHVTHEYTGTAAFFCHFGIICVLLSHLWNVSPFILLHSFALAPTSVTEVVTEERQQGTAYFRGLRIGDISHLYAGNEPASFAARFCEVYSDKEQRH